MKTFLAFCLLLLPVNAGSQTTAPDLLKTDRDFADAISHRGLEGWMSFMSENTVLSMWSYMRPVAGQAEIREYMANYFAIPGIAITITPVEAHVSPDGVSGYTTGTYHWVSPNPECRCTNDFEGTYLTAWLHWSDGRWKVKSFTILGESGIGCGCGS